MVGIQQVLAWVHQDFNLIESTVKVSLKIISTPSKNGSVKSDNKNSMQHNIITTQSEKGK